MRARIFELDSPVFLGCRILVSRAGLEPGRLIDTAQVIDSTKGQKRQNRCGSFAKMGRTDEWSLESFRLSGALMGYLSELLATLTPPRGPFET